MAAYVSGGGGGGGGGGHQSDCRAERSAEAAPGVHRGAAVMSSEASSVPNVKLYFAVNEIQSGFYKQQKPETALNTVTRPTRLFAFCFGNRHHFSV